MRMDFKETVCVQEGQAQRGDKPAARGAQFGGRHTPPVRCSAATACCPLPVLPPCRLCNYGLSSCRRRATTQVNVQQCAQHSVAAQKAEGTWSLLVPQDPNLPRLRTGLQPLLRPFQWALRTLEARMERTNLDGTLQVDAEDGGAPVQVSFRL